MRIEAGPRRMRETGESDSFSRTIVILLVLNRSSARPVGWCGKRCRWESGRLTVPSEPAGLLLDGQLLHEVVKRGSADAEFLGRLQDVAGLPLDGV